MAFLQDQIDQQRANPKIQPEFKRNLDRVDASKEERCSRIVKLPTGKSTLSQSHFLSTNRKFPQAKKATQVTRIEHNTTLKQIDSRWKTIQQQSPTKEKRLTWNFSFPHRS